MGLHTVIMGRLLRIHYILFCLDAWRLPAVVRWTVNSPLSVTVRFYLTTYVDSYFYFLSKSTTTLCHCSTSPHVDSYIFTSYPNQPTLIHPCFVFITNSHPLSFCLQVGHTHKSGGFGIQVPLKRKKAKYVWLYKDDAWWKRGDMYSLGLIQRMVSDGVFEI